LFIHIGWFGGWFSAAPVEEIQVSDDENLWKELYQAIDYSPEQKQ
jgi:hypothetical protein